MSSLNDHMFLFRELGVKHEQLKLITPQFETPLPPLQVIYISNIE